ncbi:MAG: Gfo/Idh/MocA family oxidoreductase, partial [Planctomycetes bacterium]|nr:Gfo/Idh/MocA family oxidoreductase [Planctomycetota bacterium]
MAAIRVGVVGCGGIFRGAHVPYLQWRTDRARVVAVADAKRENAQQEADRFGAVLCGDWKALVKRGDVDAVIIATHPRPHCEIAVAAARAGKHILLEKPMCRTVAEADRMIAAAEKAGVTLQVAYIFRFWPSYLKLKELLGDGTLGKPHLVYAT